MSVLVELKRSGFLMLHHSYSLVHWASCAVAASDSLLGREQVCTEGWEGDRCTLSCWGGS